MKSSFARILTLASVVTALGAAAAFANISAQDAQNLVLKEYPGATVYDVDRDRDDGYAVYSVEFSTPEIWDGEVTIDAETGKIIERDIEYRDDHHNHGRHHRR